MHLADIACPDECRESILRIVRTAGDQIQILVLDGDCGHDRAKNLLANHAHITTCLCKDRRLDKEALIAHPSAALHDLRALLHARLDVAHYAVQLLLRYQRSDLGLWIDSRPNTKRFSDPGDSLNHLLENLAMNEQA